MNSKLPFYHSLCLHLTLAVLCSASFSYAYKIVWDNDAVVDLNDIDDDLARSEERRLPNWFFIFPGTKWCGVGNIADNDNDLGVETETDKCCRTHDMCPDLIEAYQSKYGLTNPSFYTRLDCACDKKFYKCLKAVNTKTSTRVGQLYFTVLGTQCYKNDNPISGCEKYNSFPKLVNLAAMRNSPLDQAQFHTCVYQILLNSGTKWCGVGNKADNFDDLGSATETDKCCRTHDMCPDLIEGYQSKYNLTNPSFYTRLNCGCDMEFYNCLKAVNTKTSNGVGHLYFTTIGTQCYKYDNPITGCKKHKFFPKRKCIEYKFAKRKPKKYQWFDLPNFK